MKQPYLLDQDNIDFPNPQAALEDPNGLLAIGGDLSVERLLAAYNNGIFPWFSGAEPIMWWSPDPRAVIFPRDVKISKSLQKTLRNKSFQITFNKNFKKVIEACAKPRDKQDETWITSEMINAYNELHRLGHAHSVEVWQKDELVGGLYGVQTGKVFAGESMFSTQSDTAKIALIALTQHADEWQFDLIDCQIPNDFLTQMGATEMPREEFLAYLLRSQ